jgi:hypothetical protein
MSRDRYSHIEADEQTDMATEALATSDQRVGVLKTFPGETVSRDERDDRLLYADNRLDHRFRNVRSVYSLNSDPSCCMKGGQALSRAPLFRPGLGVVSVCCHHERIADDDATHPP